MTVEIHPYSRFAGNIRDYKVKRCDGNGNVKKKKHRCDNFLFYGERKQATTKFYVFLNLDMVPRNSTAVGFTYI